MNAIVLRFLFLFSLFSGTPGAASAEQFSHAPFDRILQQIVHSEEHSSAIDYRSLAKNHSTLDTYIATLSEITASEFRAWSAESQLAFLLNAYNALILQMIADHYPLDSIRDLSTDEKSVWKLEFFTLFGKQRSLDFLKHELIRKRFKEPRIHFALVGGAVSSPPLRNEAYEPKTVMDQLEDQKRRFLLSPEHNYLDEKTGILYLSKIFSWFRDDFMYFSPVRKVSITEYVDAYMSQKYALPLVPEIRFLPYNWKLNEHTK